MARILVQGIMDVDDSELSGSRDGKYPLNDDAQMLYEDRADELGIQTPKFTLLNEAQYAEYMRTY